MRTGQRTPLYQVIPLESPFLVQIFPCYACNFKCSYCLYALPRHEHGYISDKTFMDFKLYKSVVDDMATAGWRLKMLRFAAIGEPLLHSQIAEMVAYAVEKRIADTVDIVTNASMLTEKLADELIAAGLSTLRVSLEGLSSGDYRKNCGVDVDFECIKEVIAYYYSCCGNSRVYVKIIDYMLEGDSKRKKLFYDTFKPISHSIAVEHLTPSIDGIDYGKISEGIELSLTQDGNEIKDVYICPQPFYIIQVNPDGNLVPCCAVRYPGVFGDVTKIGITSAWNGKALSRFRKAMLMGVKNATEVCANCSLYRYGIYNEDILDGHEEHLLEKLSSI